MRESVISMVIIVKIFFIGDQKYMLVGTPERVEMGLTKVYEPDLWWIVQINIKFIVTRTNMPL